MTFYTIAARMETLCIDWHRTRITFQLSPNKLHFLAHAIFIHEFNIKRAESFHFNHRLSSDFGLWFLMNSSEIQSEFDLITKSLH